MSKGISISSINQIKELAEEKRYAEALEILDTQDLNRSINPQFLRISGEIFRKNKRYYDCRRVLLNAHQMSPQGTRIISELIQLYLELGYFSLANKYYEEYNFYVGPEDTQKDFVEYVIKKANGADIKELASILIPILERMPEDHWNYEAVLLYDKMDRKDKALDESRFILENFKDSVYVDRVIAYIDDKLNVDEEFYVYPDSEKEDDVEVYGDLIELEKKLLEKDFLEMYPPEARIVVEVEDKDGIDAKPVKEKKPKKKIRLKKNALSEQEETSSEDKAGISVEADAVDSTSSKIDTEDTSSEAHIGNSESEKDIQEQKEGTSEEESKTVEVSEQTEDVSTDKPEAEDTDKENQSMEASETEQTDEAAEEPELSEEERIKKDRETALDKLLSKKLDSEAIKESAKQLADAVKNIDTTKAKVQVKAVTSRVSDNVKRASDVIGEAVGAKTVMDSPEQKTFVPETEMIVDGIIEDVLEPPKQTVGQVVMNEELDSLVPDSIEAMSADEIADIELRKEEQERLELEALEAAVKLEEEKREKKKRGKNAKESEEDSSYSVLKNQFIETYVKEDPVVDSLGFISIVHSDVDETMEEHIPDTAQMLHQMIDNKEYYNDENSLGFETKDSYNNHGFEIESYDVKANEPEEKFVYVRQDYNSDVYKVEDIYTEKPILSFDDLIPDEIVPMDDYVQSDEWTHRNQLLDDSIISIVDDGFESVECAEESDSQEEPLTSESDEAAYTTVTEVEKQEPEEVSDTDEPEDIFDIDEPEESVYEAETETDSAKTEVERTEAAYTAVTEVEKPDSEEVSDTDEPEDIFDIDEPEESVYEAETETDTAKVEVERTEAAYTAETEVEKPEPEEVSDTDEPEDIFNTDEPVYASETEETVIGQQLSFDIETPSEKAKRARVELRMRIVISDSMEKKLLALKEAK